MAAGVHLRLRGVGDEQHHEIRLGDDVEGLAERAVLLGEAARARLLVGLRGGAEADAHLGVHARLLQRVAEVLALRGRLGAPPDDADGVDALERLGKLLEEVAAAAHDVLALAGDVHELLLENLGVDVELGGDDTARERDRLFRGVGFTRSDGLAGAERAGAGDGRGRERGRGGHGRHDAMRRGANRLTGASRAACNTGKPAEPQGRHRENREKRHRHRQSVESDIRLREAIARRGGTDRVV
jgi:hypothetical protein